MKRKRSHRHVLHRSKRHIMSATADAHIAESVHDRNATEMSTLEYDVSVPSQKSAQSEMSAQDLDVNCTTLEQKEIGGPYNRVRLMCDDLWHAGIESFMITADLEARKVRSFGSSTGSLFLQEQINMKEKFLDFCFAMTGRPTELMEATDMTASDHDDDEHDDDNDDYSEKVVAGSIAEADKTSFTETRARTRDSSSIVDQLQTCSFNTGSNKRLRNRILEPKSEESYMDINKRLRNKAMEPELDKSMPKVDNNTSTLLEKSPELHNETSTFYNKSKPTLHKNTPVIDRKAQRRDKNRQKMDKTSPVEDKSTLKEDKNIPKVDRNHPNVDKKIRQKNAKHTEAGKGKAVTDKTKGVKCVSVRMEKSKSKLQQEGKSKCFEKVHDSEREGYEISVPIQEGKHVKLTKANSKFYEELPESGKVGNAIGNQHSELDSEVNGIEINIVEDRLLKLTEVKARIQDKLECKVVSVNKEDESRYDKDTSDHVASTKPVESRKYLNNTDLEKQSSIERRENMIECLTDSNYVTIKKDDSDIVHVWPVDKVYDKEENKGDCSYVCKLCGKSFGAKSMVIRHVRCIHSSETPYQCKVCEKLFKYKDLAMKHVRIHVDKTHGCNMCGKKFVDANRLKTHLKTHSKNREYVCGICQSTFIDKTTYNEHLNSVHNNMKVRCEECGWLVRDHYSLRRHKIAKHTSAKNLKCDLCNKSFKLQENLTLHRRRFHETRFTCDICGLNQPTLYSLRKHKEMVHEKKADMICDVCGKAFIYKHRFQIHRRMHTGDLPFKCSYCNKRYSSKESCMHHENTHTHAHKYICDICGQTYLQYGHLARHKQLHDKSAKPIKCKYCNAGFRAYSAYRTHVFNQHRAEELASGSKMILQCDYCNKLFAHPTHFKSHIYRHTGEKPYSCEICGKKFNDQSNLRQHKYTHNDKNSFYCNICEKTFTQRRAFRTHMTKKHGNTGEKWDSSAVINVASKAPIDQALDGLGIHTELGNVKKLGNVTELGTVTQLGNVAKLGKVTNLGNVTNLGTVTNLANVTELGKVPNLGSVTELGNVTVGQEFSLSMAGVGNHSKDNQEMKSYYTVINMEPKGITRGNQDMTRGSKGMNRGSVLAPRGKPANQNAQAFYNAMPNEQGVTNTGENVSNFVTQQIQNNNNELAVNRRALTETGNAPSGQGYTQNYVDKRQPTTDASAQIGDTEIYVVNLYNQEEMVTQDGGVGSDAMTELQMQRSAVNDGQNYVFLPQNDKSTPTVLVWQDEPV